MNDKNAMNGKNELTAFMVDLYSHELIKCADAIRDMGADDDRYSRVLDSVNSLKVSLQWIFDTQLEVIATDANTPVIEETKASTPEVVGKKSEPAAQPSQTTMSKEEVRALLAEASNNGVQIQPIIERFVPEGKTVKFSEIPVSKYGELVEAINNAR